MGNWLEFLLGGVLVSIERILIWECTTIGMPVCTLSDLFIWIWGGSTSIGGAKQNIFVYRATPNHLFYHRAIPTLLGVPKRNLWAGNGREFKFHHITTSNLYVASGGNPLVHKTPVGEHKATKRPVAVRSPPQAAWCSVKVDFQVQGCYEGWCYIWWICKWLMVYRNIYIYIYIYDIYLYLYIIIYIYDEFFSQDPTT